MLLFVINVICCWWHANLSVDFIKMKLCWNVVRSLGNKHKYYLAYNNIHSTYLLSLFWIDGKKRPQQISLLRTCSECFIVYVKRYIWQCNISLVWMYDINQYKISCFETECAWLVVALILIDLKIHVHTFWSLESSFWKPISVDDPQ